MGEALPWGKRLKHLRLLFKKIRADDGNLCVVLHCCGQREADTGAKAFDLWIWAAKQSAEMAEQRCGPSLRWF